MRLDTQQSGFGLGLAIAKSAVDAHGGSVVAAGAAVLVPGNAVFRSKDYRAAIATLKSA